MELAWYLHVIGLEGAALVAVLAAAVALVVLAHWFAESERCALREMQRARLERAEQRRKFAERLRERERAATKAARGAGAEMRRSVSTPLLALRKSVSSPHLAGPGAEIRKSVSSSHLEHLNRAGAQWETAGKAKSTHDRKWPANQTLQNPTSQSQGHPSEMHQSSFGANVRAARMRKSASSEQIARAVQSREWVRHLEE
jgi:hypothetical protein